MSNNTFTWLYKEVNLEFISNTSNESNEFTKDFLLNVSINSNDTKDLISVLIEDESLLSDFKNSLTQLLIIDHKVHSTPLPSTEGMCEHSNIISSFIKPYVYKEEIGEPLIDNFFLTIERFDYEIKEHVYDDISINTSYRMTFAIPLYKGSQIFKSIIINDLSTDRIMELHHVVCSFIKAIY